jgi:hypothetical protein
VNRPARDRRHAAASRAVRLREAAKQQARLHGPSRPCWTKGPLWVFFCQAARGCASNDALASGGGRRIGEPQRNVHRPLLAAARSSLQVVHKRLGDVPVVPELCFAPRLAGPWIPGRAVGPPAADSDLPVRCPFFGWHMRGRAAEVGITEFLHEFHFSRSCSSAPSAVVSSGVSGRHLA